MSWIRRSGAYRIPRWAALFTVTVWAGTTPVAQGTTLTDPLGNVVETNVVSGGGGPATAPDLVLNSAAGQPVTGVSASGVEMLYHGGLSPFLLPWEEGDDDGDGLSNGCEAEHPGLDPDSPDDPMADPDGDGISNADECAQGTDPFTPDSVMPATSPPYVWFLVALLGIVGAAITARRRHHV